MRIGGQVKAMRGTIPYEKTRPLPMFREVGDAVISSLLEGAAAKLKRYGKHETVFVAQSAVRHVFVVVSGALKISEYGENGDAHILRICRPGHIVGLAHVLAQLVASGQLTCRKNVFRLLK